jgi:hypothetical protein
MTLTHNWKWYIHGATCTACGARMSGLDDNEEITRRQAEPCPKRVEELQAETYAKMRRDEAMEDARRREHAAHVTLDLDAIEAHPERQPVVETLRALVARVRELEAVRDEASGYLADIHRRVGRGDLGSAKQNYNCILSDLLGASMARWEAMEEVVETERRKERDRIYAADAALRARYATDLGIDCEDDTTPCWDDIVAGTQGAGQIEARASIVAWLRALGRRCPSLGMPERRYWYDGVADEIEKQMDRPPGERR